MKIIFGACFLLQPQYSFIFAGAILSGVIAANTYAKIKGVNWENFKDAYNNGTLWKEVKNTIGTGIGSVIGLVAPVVGAGLAAFGALTYLAGNPSGVEGIFYGTMLASAVSFIGVPLVGVAFVIEGGFNASGQKFSIIKSSMGIAKNILNTVQSFVGIARSGDDKQQEAVKEASKPAKDAVSKIKEVATKLNQEIDTKTHKAETNLGVAEKDKKSWRSYIVDATSALFHGPGRK